MIIDHISLSTTPIFLRQGEQVVSQGTGFYFVKKNDENQVLFLVTNYHVLTGSAPNERKPPIGDNILFQFHESEIETGRVRNTVLPLFTPSGRPLWISSMTYPEADLAIIPLPAECSKDCKVFCLSEEWANPRMKIRPATDISLVGYPYGYYDTANALPVWKSGTLASEPSVNFEEKPLVLVDVSAFPGMSGSPVFAVANGMYENVDGNSVSPGVVRQFIGIYASMQMVGKNKFLEEIVHNTKLGIKDYESLEIGHVWKSDLVIDAINNIDVHQYADEILGEFGRTRRST
ncbi:trypsin-like peptidase [Geothermobacter ehrlichii]|uniref:Trypsin-like peptidase n=1 Tax=Geothermobacter ehrlichii TaxID=213224 RepID=A0A5D3WGC9_9BACT|nr:trypsin-like peptidase domain-containing protein [Geothermobacter ehrlichii]TYO95747.1 trypsin-like peptidase [Geothermobacter ehrlichii]